MVFAVNVIIRNGKRDGEKGGHPKEEEASVVSTCIGHG
jgi:hypothetical protein